MAPHMLPNELVTAINAGNCVAFVGAGFSAPAVPRWHDLLLQLTEKIDGKQAAERLKPRIRAMRDDELAAVAQRLRDGAERSKKLDRLLRKLAAGDPDHPAMKRRLDRLRGIPFAAILTTNFDTLLPGKRPEPRHYLDVLRGDRASWTHARYWGNAPLASVKLHGSVADKNAVFARREYRDLLYRSPAYLTFLRALFATRTVLYLGFSFTDAYLNEVRSEVLALVGQETSDAPIAYATVHDVDKETRQYYREHEGLGLLNYASDEQHSGFDKILDELHARTNPTKRLGDLVKGRRILWVDKNRGGNAFGERLLREASPDSVRCVDTIEDGLAALCEDGEMSTDLVITRWGHAGAGHSDAEQLIRAMRTRDILSPVIVFAKDIDANRTRALRLGAFAYEHEWSGLFGAIERLFSAIGRPPGT